MSVFTVQARLAQPAAVCSSALRMRVPFRPPGRPARLRILALTTTGAVVGWSRARPRDAPLAGYRVERDGAVAGQTRRLRFSLRLSNARAHTVTVLAVDTRGHVGAARTISCPPDPGEQQPARPERPGALSASEISSSGATLWWLASTPGGAPSSAIASSATAPSCGQTAQTSMRLEKLSFPRSYAVSVAAVDAERA